MSPSTIMMVWRELPPLGTRKHPAMSKRISARFLVGADESYGGTAQTVLPVGKARTLPRSSFSQSAYLIITSRRRSTAVILR